MARNIEPGKIRIMVIDDEQVVLDSCRRILERTGYAIETVKDPRSGLDKALGEFFDLIIVDLMMPRIGGLEVLKAVKQRRPETAVVMITGYATVQNAVEAMKRGASDYVAKPFEPNELSAVVQRALEAQSPVKENLALLRELQSKPQLGELIGRSPAMSNLFREILKVAPTLSTVLICGESGTGKELVAKEIHSHSARKARPFIVADCSTLAPSLLESELFGHTKGSFTGAERAHKGLFELANGGTLFMDEIANIGYEIQGRLLRVLECREFKQVGGEKLLKVDIRLVAATNQDIWKMVQQGAFREDLFYRLNVVPMHIPPLRERAEDISILAMHFLRDLANTHAKEIKSMGPGALERLTGYTWPGNVRELRNTMERLAIMTEGAGISQEQVSAAIGQNQPPTAKVQGLKGLKEAKKLVRQTATAQIERVFVLRALEKNEWNIARTAREIGIHRSNLYAMMRKLGIRPKGNHSA